MKLYLWLLLVLNSVLSRKVKKLKADKGVLVNLQLKERMADQEVEEEEEEVEVDKEEDVEEVNRVQKVHKKDAQIQEVKKLLKQ